LVANVNQPLSLRLDSKNLAQIVQILTNLEYLENACQALEELLMQSRSTHRVGTLKLAATTEFGNTRLMAEKRVFELVNSKIDDFLDIADYDWFPRYFIVAHGVIGCQHQRTPTLVRICKTWLLS
jgi:exocyst complex component 6